MIAASKAGRYADKKFIAGVQATGAPVLQFLAARMPDGSLAVTQFREGACNTVIFNQWLEDLLFSLLAVPVTGCFRCWLFPLLAVSVAGCFCYWLFLLLKKTCVETCVKTCVVVMDNATSHKSAKTRELIKAKMFKCF